MPAPPRLVGIAGPSGAGKTTLARRLASLLPGRTRILALDSYYQDLSYLSPAERQESNFDHPEALDRDLLARHLQELSQGRAVDRPVYCFSSHTRTPQGEQLEPGDYLLIEGLFTLYWEDIRGLFHASIFVEAPDSACLERRLARDVAERGRTPESVREQYIRTVRPMAEQYVRPTRRFAEWVVSGEDPIEETVSLLLARLRPLLGPHLAPP